MSGRLGSRTADFEYELPPGLIAQEPLAERAASRMMVLDRGRRTIAHRHVAELPDVLHAGDLLVVNDTRVIPARVFGERLGTGGKVELLLLERAGAPLQPARSAGCTGWHVKIRRSHEKFSVGCHAGCDFAHRHIESGPRPGMAKRRRHGWVAVGRCRPVDLQLRQGLQGAFLSPGQFARRARIDLGCPARSCVASRLVVLLEVHQRRQFLGAQPEDRQARIQAILAAEGPFISVDFTHPTAVVDNARFYCEQRLPFVMGTTGGNRDQLIETVTGSSNAAVIAPNMAKQIVGLQAMFEFAADNFPNLFKGYQFTLRESHQAGKADTSGTAKAMVGYFNKMGIDFTPDQIEKERDPERQNNMWGVPTAHLEGHAWHTYTLISGDDTTKFEFTHNINGRDIYSEGTLDAVCFLTAKLSQGAKGTVYSMIDVLKAASDY